MSNLGLFHRALSRPTTGLAPCCAGRLAANCGCYYNVGLGGSHWFGLNGSSTIFTILPQFPQKPRNPKSRSKLPGSITRLGRGRAH